MLISMITAIMVLKLRPMSVSSDNVVVMFASWALVSARAVGPLCQVHEATVQTTSVVIISVEPVQYPCMYARLPPSASYPCP